MYPRQTVASDRVERTFYAARAVAENMGEELLHRADVVAALEKGGAKEWRKV